MTTLSVTHNRYKGAYIRVTCPYIDGNGKRCVDDKYISIDTTYGFSKEFWTDSDNARQQGKYVTTKHDKHVILNQQIKARLFQVEKYITDNTVTDPVTMETTYPTPSEVHAHFMVKKGRDFTPLETLMDEFIKYKQTDPKEKVGKASITGYIQTFKIMLALNPDINVNNITPQYRSDLEAYCSQPRPTGKLYKWGPMKGQPRFMMALTHNSFASHLSAVHAFLQWTVKPDGITKKRLSSMPPEFLEAFFEPTDRVDIFWLRHHERDALKSLPREMWSKDDTIIDRFILGTYVGQRYSDMHPETWEISGGFIHITSKKTGVTAHVPVTDEIMEILDKYKGIKMPVISNHDANNRLKVLALQAGLTREQTLQYGKKRNKKGDVVRICDQIGTHWERSTAVCLASLTGIYTINDIMEMYGITDIKTIKKYLAFIPEQLKEKAERVRMKKDGVGQVAFSVA